MPEYSKQQQLDQHRRKNTDGSLTSDSGFKVSNNHRTLRAGKRGPLLFQDFHFYKKQSHFSRERIPEKVVHARGFGVHGVFECTKSMKHVTKAHFVQEAGRTTTVCVRFSIFIGYKTSE